MRNFLTKNSIKLLALILLLAPVFICSQAAYGQDTGYDFGKDSGLNQTADSGGFLTGAGAMTVDSLLARTITVVLSLIGVIFLVFVIYGGFTWMTADGKEEKIKSANTTITNSLFGLMITLSAYVISYFLINYFR